MCSAWFPRSILPADASLPSPGSSGASSPDSTVLSKRYDFLPPFPPCFVAFAWRYHGSTRLGFAPAAGECAAVGPGVGHPVSPAGNFRGDDRISQVPGEPRFSVCTCSPTPAGLLAPDHYGAAAWPLDRHGAKAPTKGLSRLNSMAFGLAVYASQGRLLRPHARLASGCWSGSPGRAFHPQGSNERFQDCFLTSLSSSPKLCLAQRG